MNYQLRPQDMQPHAGDTCGVPDEGFQELLRHATPVDADLVARLQELVAGVDVDLDAPLNPDDE